MRAHFGCGRGASVDANGGVNSLRSNAASSSSDGTGQVIPTTAARRRSLRHGVAADPDHRRDLVPAMAAHVFEAEDFSNLTHPQSLAWHGAPRVAGSDRAVGGRLLAIRAACPYSGAAGMPRNRWLASVGITGWFAPESGGF